MKIVISYPPLKGAGSPMLTQNRQFQWYNVPSFIYPLVPAMAATILDQDGFEVVWNDCIAEGWTYPQFIESFEHESPDLIAFEVKTPVIRQFWHIVDELKGRNPACKTVIMGDHVTALPRETMENSRVDYVITGGDYDFSLRDLARHLRDGGPLPSGLWYRENGAIRTTGPFRLDDDLNVLPFHNRTLTKAHLYGEKWKKREPFFYTMVGRDCHWGRCTFCAWTTTYPRYRTRHYSKLLDEIGYLIEEHGAREIFDDTGTFPAGGWLRSFCRGLIEREYNDKVLFSCNMRYGYMGNLELPRLMKRAGFRKMKMGLESANQETLDRLNKGVTVQKIIEESRMLSQAGIDIHLTVMVGYPWETREDAQRTIDLARELMARGHAEMLQSTVIVPYPGTPLYEQAVENGWFKDGLDPTDWDRFDMREQLFNMPDMEPAEAMELCAQVYKTFLTPRYVLRHLGSIRSLQDLGYVWRGAKAVIGHLKDFLDDRRRDVTRRSSV
jgi:radical SAM superfamily enzyme YgiQ (UPF0313 family)